MASVLTLTTIIAFCFLALHITAESELHKQIRHIGLSANGQKIAEKNENYCNKLLGIKNYENLEGSSTETDGCYFKCLYEQTGVTKESNLVVTDQTINDLLKPKFQNDQVTMFRQCFNDEILLHPNRNLCESYHYLAECFIHAKHEKYVNASNEISDEYLN